MRIHGSVARAHFAPHSRYRLRSRHNRTSRSTSATACPRGSPKATFPVSQSQLRRALEHRFGRSLQQLSDSILFRPLHMTETSYGWNPRLDTARFAFGHDTLGARVNEPMHTSDRPNAADWLVTSVGDYARFAS
jgi:hypothetical protein